MLFVIGISNFLSNLFKRFKGEKNDKLLDAIEVRRQKLEDLEEKQKNADEALEAQKKLVESGPGKLVWDKDQWWADAAAELKKREELANQNQSLIDSILDGTKKVIVKDGMIDIADVIVPQKNAMNDASLEVAQITGDRARETNAQQERANMTVITKTGDNVKVAAPTYNQLIDPGMGNSSLD